MSRSILTSFRRTTVISALLVSLILSAALVFDSPTAHADRWELFDKGEHLLLPEGPVSQDGAILVPLRPIAERFGYTFTSVTSTATTLKDRAGHSFTIKPGSNKAVKNGTELLTLEQPPRYINGSLFIPLSLAGAIGGSGYSILPGTNLIQLTPAEGDAIEQLNSQYLFSFRKPSGTVFVDNKGQELQTTVYTDLLDFGYEDLIPVYQSNKGIGYLNREGKLAFEASHYRLGTFSEGLAAFKDMVPVTGGGFTIRMGFLNRTGKIVIPATYDRVYDFSDGLAKVVKGSSTYYIDHNGKVAIPKIPGSQNTRPFSEGLAEVTILVKSGGQTTNKTGYINTKGKWSLKPIYDWAGPFSEGIAVATLNGKQGLIDKTGKWIVKPQNKEGGFAGSFENGYIVFTEKKGAGYKYTLYDAKGTQINVPWTDYIGSISEGLVTFRVNDAVGLKNLAGDIITKPQFSWLGTFEAGAAKGEIDNKDNTYTSVLLDTTGKVIWRSDGKPLK